MIQNSMNNIKNLICDQLKSNISIKNFFIKNINNNKYYNIYAKTNINDKLYYIRVHYFGDFYDNYTNTIIETIKQNNNAIKIQNIINGLIIFNICNIGSYNNIHSYEIHNILNNKVDIKYPKCLLRYDFYNSSYTIDNTWISASQTRNYALDDPLCDFFKYHESIGNLTNILNENNIDDFNENDFNENLLTQKLLNDGNNFENHIYNILKNKLKNDIVKIADSQDDIRNPKNFIKTKLAIKLKIPIIYQGVFHHEKTKIYGCPDLLILGSYINQLFNCSNISNVSNNKYYIIDIKHSVLPFNADMITIRNNKNIKPFKLQLAMYCNLINKLFTNEIETDFAMLLGSGWSHINQTGKVYNNDPFNKLGLVDFNDKDLNYLNLLNDAIDWLKEVRSNNRLKINPPNNKNLYPNMSNHLDGKYNNLKRKLSNFNDEITDIWMCGIKQRDLALQKKICKWSDKKLNASLMGLKNDTGKIVDAILDTNRNKTKQLIFPADIKSNLGNWKDQNKLAFYIDFETLNSQVIESDDKYNNDIIFMIGVGWSYNNEWSYKDFTLKDLSKDEQTRVINEFYEYINKIILEHNLTLLDVSLFHWSNFEPCMLTKIINKLNINIDYKTLKWIDLLELFKKEPITIKGAKNFSLKTIGKAFYNNNLITICWNDEDTVCNGLDAMILAHNAYQKPGLKKSKKLIDKIIGYNIIDCKIMWEILNVLRKHNKNY